MPSRAFETAKSPLPNSSPRFALFPFHLVGHVKPDTNLIPGFSLFVNLKNAALKHVIVAEAQQLGCKVVLIAGNVAELHVLAIDGDGVGIRRIVRLRDKAQPLPGLSLEITFAPSQ